MVFLHVKFLSEYAKSSVAVVSSVLFLRCSLGKGFTANKMYLLQPWVKQSATPCGIYILGCIQYLLITQSVVFPPCWASALFLQRNCLKKCFFFLILKSRGSKCLSSFLKRIFCCNYKELWVWQLVIKSRNT